MSKGSYSKAHRLYKDFSEDRARLGQLRMRCGAMATRGRISIAPISRIFLITFVNIYAKFGAFITNGNDFTG